MKWYKLNEGPLDENYEKPVWISNKYEVFIDCEFDKRQWSLEMHKDIRWAPIQLPDRYRGDE